MGKIDSDSIRYRVGKHIPELDGIRGLAILPVLVYHFVDLVPHPAGFQQTLFFRLCRTGWFGVDLFFVLSGYLITSILFHTKQSPNFFRSFYGRRFLRIFPMYYAALAVFFIVTPIASSEIARHYTLMREHQAWFWLYGANILYALEGSFGRIPGGYFWSLAVEEQFYLIWPWVVYYLDRDQLRKVTVGMVLFSLVGRILLLKVFQVSPTAVYCIPFTHMDGLAIGSYVALRFSDGEDLREITRRFDILGILALVATVTTGVWLGNLPFWHPKVASGTYSYLALFFVSVLVFVISNRSPFINRYLFGNSVLRSFGKYSYSLYVIHPPVGHMLGITIFPMVIDRYFSSSHIVASSIFIIVATIACWVLSFLIWNLFEKHFLKLKKYFPY